MSLLGQVTVSSLPLSIGTSLAFETLLQPKLPPYDPNREIPPHANITDYQRIYINIQTLFRNVLAALPQTIKSSVKSEEVLEVMLQEMEVLSSSIEIESNQTCKAIYYYPTYSKLIGAALLPKQVKFRMPNTEIQKAYNSLLVSTCKAVIKTDKYPVYEVNNLIKPSIEKDPPTGNVKAVIFTHTPYDLLAYDRFRTLDLLESHTGLLKSRSKWYTKYYAVGDSDLSILPFIRPLLLIFGDHTLISPMEYKFRKLILDIGTNRNWNPLTTPDKVMFDLDNDIKERFLVELYRKLR